MSTAKKKYVVTAQQVQVVAKYGKTLEQITELLQSFQIEEIENISPSELKKELEEANELLDKVTVPTPALVSETAVKEKTKSSKKNSKQSPEAQKTAELIRKALFEAAHNDNYKLVYLDEKVKGHTNPAYLWKDGKFITGEICDKQILSSASPLMLWSLAKGHYDALKAKYPHIAKKITDEQLLLLKKNKEQNHGS